MLEQPELAFVRTRVHLSPNGSMLLASGDDDLVIGSELSRAGMKPVKHPGGWSVAARHLAAFLSSSTWEPVLEPELDDWARCVRDRFSDLPVVLDLSPTGAMSCTWHGPEGREVFALPRKVWPLLLAGGVPFEASTAAFRELQERSGVERVHLGSVRPDERGFLRIDAAAPQLVVAAGLPGLFRLGPAVFGVAAQFASDITRTPGFSWSEPPLPPRPSPASVAVPGSAAGATARRIARDIAAGVAAQGSVVVAGASAGNRRRLAVAAAIGAEALPVAVVAAPQAHLSWHRILPAAGLAVGRAGVPAPAWVLTPDDALPLAARAVIVDEPALLPAEHWVQDHKYATHLARIALVQDAPVTPADTLAVFSTARPSEFTVGESVAERYPGASWEALAAHAAAYLVHAGGQDSPADMRSPGVTLVEADLPPELRQAQSDLLAGRTLEEAVEDGRLRQQLIHLAEFGTPLRSSPKAARVLGAVSDAYRAGGLIAVMSRDEALLERVLLSLPKGAGHMKYAGADVPVSTRVLLLGMDPSALGNYKPRHLIISGHPSRVTEAAIALGDPGPNAPNLVQIHLRGSVDDALARLSVRH